MGVPADLALTAVRLSLGPATTGAEVERVLGLIPAAVAEVRALGAPAGV